ncbi:hypothetical protein MAR_011944 [Mya arenaria]|uniref:Cell wall hydrolase SleB domain-containing protein n=1 Tax=Mya arenaria TaxID=6604 RepID=A0ABY7FVM7_MYAAR|nr:hypothetical protein MAR_011944 [Mya arenaria]
MSDEEVARVVFGESRGEPMAGQRAVAHSIYNRTRHPGYPNTVHEVNWEEARRNNSREYQNAMSAAHEARTNPSADPTRGAVDFASRDPWPSTNDNDHWRATNKQQIGNQYFVKREPR